MKKIEYKTFGDKKNPALILISGLSAQLLSWSEIFINELVAKGFYVIVFDNRDVGLSQSYADLPDIELAQAMQAKERGEEITIPYTLDDMAEDVIELMDRLDIAKAHIGGISMGGMIAQLVGINHPARTLSVILLATTSGNPDLLPAKPEVLEYLFSRRRNSEGLKDYLANKLALYKIYNPCLVFDEDKFCEKGKMIYERSKGIKGGFKRQLMAVMFAKPRHERLKELTMPTLVVHGDCDPVFHLDHGQELAEHTPSSRFEVVHNLGHGLPDVFCVEVADIIADYLLK